LAIEHEDVAAAIDLDIDHRAERRRPSIHGPDTEILVGAPGRDIGANVELHRNHQGFHDHYAPP
jgi:hypothetical protein